MDVRAGQHTFDPDTVDRMWYCDAHSFLGDDRTTIINDHDWPGVCEGPDHASCGWRYLVPAPAPL